MNTADSSLPWPGWLDDPLNRLLAMRARLPHALLLEGPAGIGKALLAERFAQSLVCEQPAPTGLACNHCNACGWFKAGQHPDVRRVSPIVDEDTGAKSERTRREIKIDQIRALADFVGIGAHRAGHKIVLLDPADALNTPAANALLKTLEEPAGDTVFLLVSGRAGALSPTVRSRCVPFHVAAPSSAEALAWLVSTAPTESAQFPRWLALADGAPRRALAFAEPTAAAAHRLILQLGAELPDNGIWRTVDGLAATPASTWVPMLQVWIADLGRVGVGAKPMRFPDQAQRLVQLARRTRPSRIASFGRWLLQQTPILEHPLNPRLFAEDVCLRYAAIFEAARGQG